MASEFPGSWSSYAFVEEEGFLSEAEQAFGSARVWDDMRNVLEKDIVRDPTLFFPVVGKPNCFFATTNTVPPCIILFRVRQSERRVYYQSVKRGGYG